MTVTENSKSQGPAAQRPRVLSGMRPTGKLHLGNYMGALANWVKLQDQYECYFFIADWHALTTDYADPQPDCAEHARGDARLPGGGARSRAQRAVFAEPRKATRRTCAAAGHEHSAGLAGTRAQLQGDAGESRQQGPDDLRIPRLPGADGRGHSALPGRLCAGGPGPAGARGADARECAAVQPVLRSYKLFVRSWPERYPSGACPETQQGPARRPRPSCPAPTGARCRRATATRSS